MGADAPMWHMMPQPGLQYQHAYPAMAYSPYSQGGYMQQGPAGTSLEGQQLGYSAAGSGQHGVAAAASSPALPSSATLSAPPLPGSATDGRPEEGEIQQPGLLATSAYEVAEKALQKQAQLRAAAAGQPNGVQQAADEAAAPPLPASLPPVPAQDAAAEPQPGSRPSSAQGVSKPPSVIKTNRPLLNIQRRPAR